MENRKFIHSKNGEPTELYLVLMRIGGVFFIICSVGMIIYLIIK